MSEGATGILWLDMVTFILLPIIIGPIFIFFKSLWDRYNSHKKDSYLLHYNTTVEKYKNQLKNFYWPIYVYLLEEYVLWSIMKTNYERIRNTEETASETDSDYDIDKELYATCDYVNEKTGEKCSNIVPLHCIKKYESRCLHHLNKNKVGEMVFKEFTINDEELNVVDLEKGNETLEEIYNSCIQDDDIKSEKTITEPMLAEVQKKLLSNHKKIVNIIEKYIYLAEPDKYMRKLLMNYIQFANMLSIIIDTDEDVEKLKEMDIRYPRKLLPIIERYVNLIQEKYNKITNNYFKKFGNL